MIDCRIDLEPRKTVIDITPMTVLDIGAATTLWTETEGMTVRDADAPPDLERFLQRNPGCSFAARAEGRVIGVSLCGHDGRRGYLYHVAVDRHYRRRGIGAALVEKCLQALLAEGILKCHLLVFRHNTAGLKFWEKIGWKERTDLAIVSRALGHSENG